MPDAPLYRPNPLEQRAITQRDKLDGVLAAGPWIKGSGEKPHRIVLRYYAGSFITHMQTLFNDGRGETIASFSHGTYCPGSPETNQPNFNMAIGDFIDRIARQQGIAQDAGQ
jgi:hypothetical protein